MATFITRIELHNNATWQDYDGLHKKMEAAGFTRKIQASDGVWYKLPTAEYNITANANVVQIRDAAKACANSTGKANSVLTCEYINAAWNNLDPA